MKKISNFTFFVLFATFATIVGCKEERDLQLGEPFSKLDGISATWKLVQITQTDGLATDPTKRQLVLPEDFLGDTPMTITFNSALGAYTAQSGTTILNLVGESGTWAFDDDNYPTAIAFDGSWWSLLTPTRTVDNVLKIATDHYCTITDDSGAPIAAPTIGYIYTFERQ